MAYDARPIDILPGIFKEASGYAAQNRWIDGNNVRFWKGFPEMIGRSESLESGLLFPCRGIHAWAALDGRELIAFGHARGLQLLRSSTLTDVTPTGSYGFRELIGTIYGDGKTCTITNASPCAVTLTGGTYVGLSSNTISFRFTTTGTLPTGLSTGTTYYVRNYSGSTFNVSATPTGALINTSSAGSGTHTATPYAGFTVGESVTEDGVGIGTGTIVEDPVGGTTIALGSTNGTFRIAVTGMSGTFEKGDRVVASGGGTFRVAATTSSSPIYGYDYDYSEALTGTLDGNASDTATAGAITSLWRADSSVTYVEGASSSARVAVYQWRDRKTSVEYSGTALETEAYSSQNEAMTWTMANWGEDLVACPNGGNIYLLDTSAFLADTTTDAVLISSNAPKNNLGIFMSDVNRTLVAYGAGGDPLNIAWCDEEDYTEWTPATSNTAGSIRCEDGSRIIGVIPTRGGHLISTDKSLYFFQYLGLPFVFGLQRIAQGPTMISPRAGIEFAGIAYWMGLDSFYIYDGAVRSLPCDVHQYVFGRIKRQQVAKIHCCTVKKFNEIWWYYPSDAGTAEDDEIDSYVAYNTVEQTWHIGDKARTSQIDAGFPINYPIATDANTGASGSAEYIFVEELDHVNGQGSFLYSLETHDIEVGDGTPYLHNRMIIPDYERLGNGAHQVAIEARGWPARAAVTKGPYTITSSTEFIPVRARGRTLRFIFEGLSGNVDFRMGRFRMRVTGHGAKE